MKNPFILHLESATPVCSVCLSHGAKVLSLQETHESNRHSEWLAPFVEKSLKEAGLKIEDIDAVCINGGPGSYTGLRVGVSVAKAICYAQEIPMIATGALDALASAAAAIHQDLELIVPMMDARRMEVYMAFFDSTGRRQSADEAKILDEAMFNEHLESGDRILICGNGTQKAAPLFVNRSIVSDMSISHSAIHLVNPALEAFQNKQFVDPFLYAPGYLKAPNITTPKKSVI